MYTAVWKNTGTKQVGTARSPFLSQLCFHTAVAQLIFMHGAYGRKARTFQGKHEVEFCVLEYFITFWNKLWMFFSEFHFAFLQHYIVIFFHLGRGERGGNDNGDCFGWGLCDIIRNSVGFLRKQKQND